jgi:hypothetical protein
LYSEILLFIDRPQDAQRQFEQTLLWHPNRARSVLGMARTTVRMRDLNSASQAYANFLNIGNQADPDLSNGKKRSRFFKTFPIHKIYLLSSFLTALAT